MGRKALEKKIDFEHQLRTDWCSQLFPHFQRKGLKGFGMDRVAKTLGKSKTTIYKYFETREDILGQMIGEKLSAAATFRDCLMETNQSFEIRYLNAVDIFSNNIQDISTIFLKDLKKYHPALWKDVYHFQFLALEILQEFYREGIESGQFVGDLKTLLMSDQIIFSALLNPDFLLEQKRTLQEALKDYLLLKCYGMLRRH